MKLILGEGPGSVYAENKIRVDVVPDWADIVCDLNEKIPLVKGKFDYVEAHHIFEHIESTKQLKKIMQWIYDLMEEGGILDITVPYWHSESAVECIEHVRFFNENSFMNYYSNPYAKEMKLPQFKLVVSELRDHVNHKEVHVCLQR